MADGSSEQIAEETRSNASAGLMSAQATSNGDEPAAAAEAGTTSEPAAGESAAGESTAAETVSSAEEGSAASPTVEAAAVQPAAIRRMITRYQQFPGPARRLVLWASFVLIVGLLLRAGRAVQPVFVSPQERFTKFAETVQQRLPGILYGTDPSGLPLLPVEVKWEITPAKNTGGPLQATINFEDASFSEAGQVLYTRYKIDYQWRRDHWQCVNLKCDVERPELTKLDQMDFNAVVAHESAEKNLELVKLKRSQAEAMLRPTLPLGDLLRSADLY